MASELVEFVSKLTAAETNTILEGLTFGGATMMEAAELAAFVSPLGTAMGIAALLAGQEAGSLESAVVREAQNILQGVGATSASSGGGIDPETWRAAAREALIAAGRGGQGGVVLPHIDLHPSDEKGDEPDLVSVVDIPTRPARFPFPNGDVTGRTPFGPQMYKAFLRMLLWHHYGVPKTTMSGSYMDQLIGYIARNSPAFQDNVQREGLRIRREYIGEPLWNWAAAVLPLGVGQGDRVIRAWLEERRGGRAPAQGDPSTPAESTSEPTWTGRNINDDFARNVLDRAIRVIAPSLATEEVEQVVEYVSTSPGYELDGLKQDLAYLANTNRVTDLGSPGVISALAAIASRGGPIQRHINDALRVVVGHGVLGAEQPVEEVWTDKARRLAAEWGESATGLRERASEAWDDVKRMVRNRSGHEEIENRAMEMLPLMIGQEEAIAGDLVEAGPAWVAAESAANRRQVVSAAISNVLNDLRHSGWMTREAIGRAISNIRAPSATGVVAVGSAVGFLGVVIKEVLKLVGPEIVRATAEGPQPPTAPQPPTTPGAVVKEEEDDDEEQNIPDHSGEHPSEEKVDDVFELPPVADMPLAELKQAEQIAKEETPFEVPMNLINTEYDLSNTMVRRSLAEQGLYYSGKLWVPNYTPQVPPRVDFSDQKMTASVNQSVVVNMPMQPTYQAKPNKQMNAFQGPDVELRDVPKVKLPKYKTPYDTLFRRNEFLYPGH